LGDALHGIVLWRKTNIKLIGNIAAPVDPRSSPYTVNDDHDPSLQPPSALSPPGQRARSDPTPPAPEKKKEKYIISPTGWTHKQEAEKGRNK